MQINFRLRKICKCPCTFIKGKSALMAIWLQKTENQIFHQNVPYVYKIFSLMFFSFHISWLHKRSVYRTGALYFSFRHWRFLAPTNFAFWLSPHHGNGKVTQYCYLSEDPTMRSSYNSSTIFTCQISVRKTNFRLVKSSLYKNYKELQRV